MAERATELLDALDPDQREVARRPFPDDDERRRWFYTPTDHGGLALTAMGSAQHRLVHRLVASGLSHPGYVTVATIMGLENVLDHAEGWVAGFGRERGRDPLEYRVTVFGEPGADGWAWRFGGHHVSLHFTVIDGEVVGATPCFLGADPASSPLLGPHPSRPLAGVEDLARELVHALDPEQRRRAVLSDVAPADIVGANRPTVRDGDLPLPLGAIWRGRFEGALGRRMDEIQAGAERSLGLTDEHLDAVRFTSEPRGVPVTALGDGQRDLLRALLDCYLGRLADDVADAQAARVAADLDALHFAWAGPIEAGRPHYYRIQGGSLLVEYDNTQRDANHVHSVWRDLRHDFGGDALADHHVTHHAGPP